MIVDATDPHPPEGWILRFRENERILDGNARLVVVAIADPPLQLLAGQLSIVHAAMKRMLMVIPFQPFALEPLDEDRRRERFLGGLGHRTTSIPS
jgi:hypothetical protein